MLPSAVRRDKAVSRKPTAHLADSMDGVAADAKADTEEGGRRAVVKQEEEEKEY